MRWLRFAVLILIAVLIQAGVLMNLTIRPDLLIILLVFFAVHSNPYHAIITSFTIGFAADLIGPAIGPQIISFGLLGSALAHLRKVVAVRNMIQQGITIHPRPAGRRPRRTAHPPKRRTAQHRYLRLHHQDLGVLGNRRPISFLARCLVDAYENSPFRSILIQ